MLLLALATALVYPAARIEPTIESLHGTNVADPYRWLEDDRSAETAAWVAAENQLTRQYLDALPQRAKIRERLEQMVNFERSGIPRRFGNTWFFTRNSGLQNQDLLMKAKAPDATPEILLDPNQLSADGSTALAAWSPSEDGKLLAWSTSGAGSDWNEIFVRDTSTGKDLSDHLRWVKFSGISWRKDGSGFYYSRYAPPQEGEALTARNLNQKLYFHKIGDAQEADILIYERPDQPTWGFGGRVTEDGHLLVITAHEGTSPENRVFYQDLTRPHSPIVPLLPEADASWHFIGKVDRLLYFLTNLDAPRNRLLAIDLDHPAPTQRREIIPQSADLLQSVSMIGGQLFSLWLHDAHSVIRVHEAQGKYLREIDLPGIGTAGGFAGRASDTETFYSFGSFTHPGAIFRYDIPAGKSSLWWQPKLPFDPATHETRQIFIPSRDGTKVPVFLIVPIGYQPGTPQRLLLYGYGGFNISLTPGFSVSRSAWLERGGLYAVANIRGGGEYGENWHQAATKQRKQTSYDDFTAVAEWLINNGYTTPAKLAIQGGSNGGLLVGACMTQRPELFGACLPAVGVMDLLRFAKFTIGWAWKSDYGDPDNPADFANLLKISPYHNLKPGTRYPATLVTTADHDDRVVPAHSFKFAARLQACQAAEGPPVLIRVETRAGHGAGMALHKALDLQADQISFLEANLER